MGVLLAEKQVLKFAPEAFEPVCVLFEFERPWLYLLQEKETDELFFLNWVDLVGGCNRWLFFPVSEPELRRYLHCELSRNTLLFLKKHEMLVVDSDDDWKIRRAEPAPIELPKQWLPRGEDYFDPKYCSDLAAVQEFI